MSAPILTTKLYIPPPRPKVVLRPHLVNRLNEGLHRKLTLISAPAGFGKTSLVSEWVTCSDCPVTWLSLDEGDNDPTRFLLYLVAALQKIAPGMSDGVLAMLQSPQPPPIESILTNLLNEIATIPEHFVLVLDDYHIVDAAAVDNILMFLVEHLPPHIHLIMTTREDPQLPLARLRGRGQLAELRANDLRFTPDEAAGFLNQVMGLNLSEDDITALERRTEGWIAGLQLAALALQGTISNQGQPNATTFIKNFTGSHHFVLDYLVEEVLNQQPEPVQTFLLRTSILERLCGPLCDAVVGEVSTSGQETLEYLKNANLFLVSLDDERQWYRYHQLFADLLRQRLHQRKDPYADDVSELHIRASEWYQQNGLDVEAFQHATAANDIARADRLIEGEGMPLHFRGAQSIILRWLDSLPPAVLDAHPRLWTAYASVLLVTGQTIRTEQALQSAEVALADAAPDDYTRDLIGRVAAIRSTLAATLGQIDAIITESQRALDYLHPDNLAFRTSTTWKLGFAYHLQGDRAAARRAYAEVVSIGQATGNVIFTLTATIGLAGLQLEDNQLKLAAQMCHQILEQVGDSPLPLMSEVHLSLARIHYQWNDLEAAEQHGHQSLKLVQQIQQNNRIVPCQVLLARLKLAQGDVTGATAILAEATQYARQHNLLHHMPDIIEAQVLTLLQQGNIIAAADLAQQYNHRLSLARVQVAEGEPATALELLEPLRQQMEAKGWEDARLKVMVLQALAHHANDDKDEALQLIGESLALAAPGGFIRIFVDEGVPMAHLLAEATSQGIMPDYVATLMAVLKTEVDASNGMADQHLIEPLSDRELEVLHLVAEGLSNREIGERLFLALDTVKGHNRRIYGKLQVQRRTEAIARARELGLL